MQRATGSRQRYSMLIYEGSPMLPRCSRLSTERLSSASRCGAAVGRWRAGAIAALQTQAISDTRHQSRARPNRPVPTWNDLSAVVAPTADRLRTRKPNAHAVVAVSAVVAVEMSTPRSAGTAEALPPCPTHPPVMGPTTGKSSTGHSERVVSLVQLFFIRSIRCHSEPLRFIFEDR